MKLTLENFKEIQKLKQEGYIASEVSRRRGFTQYAVYKVWNMSEEEFVKKPESKVTALDTYKEFIIEQSKLYPKMSMAQLFDRVCEQYDEDVDIGISAFTQYVNQLRYTEGLSTKKKTRQFVRVATKEPGMEAQVDLGQMKMPDMYGRTIKVYFFVMVLEYSRMKFVYFSPRPFDSKRFVYAHDKAFRYFGGRPVEIKYDQDRVAVVSENAGDIIFTEEFNKYIESVGINVYLCKGADPDTKGKVENAVRFVKINFLSNREYCGVDSLNQAALKWLDRTGNGRMHAITKESPKVMFEVEAKRLLPYEPRKIYLGDRRVVSVSDLNSVLYKSNHYSIPVGRYKQGDKVLLLLENDVITIKDLETEEIIETHDLVVGRGIVVLKKVEATTENKQLYLIKKELRRSKPAIEFLNNVASAMPRYINPQVALLRKLLENYPRKEVLAAMKKALDDKAFTVNAVKEILVSKMGERKQARKSRVKKPVKKLTASQSLKYDDLFNKR